MILPLVPVSPSIKAVCPDAAELQKIAKGYVDKIKAQPNVLDAKLLSVKCDWIVSGCFRVCCNATVAGWSQGRAAHENAAAARSSRQGVFG
jgi:hypothetical protein